jgi:tRNA wybutosine-synthesizing protein 3
MSKTPFEQTKARILKTLEVDPETYTDLSPKGSIDENIKELIDIINSHPQYVTSSSCSGRVSVYLEGKKRPENETEMVASTGGKGGGKWILVEHDPIDLSLPCWRESLLQRFNLKETAMKIPENASLIHIKFEPMVCVSFCTTDIFR